jgi:Tol biopolymer transport system component/predicted Ser/Thr protein kinase
MIPKQLLHYTILEPLGQGGMGEVYAAEDTRLHRKVAIKVLSALMAGDPERRQRFEREAHAVAALNHPNIVTIYAVEEAAGVPFLVMELVEGRPLGELIPAGGLPVDAVLRVGGAISDAMGAAHQKGITHRDLKPANVMVAPDGRVKVLDFGLAKLREAELDPEGETRLPSGELTGEGRIMGTVAYMSPEQAEGKPVDPRSDIFSLGVLLHEMSTGQRPFKGDTNVSVISSILKDTPSSITDLNPRLPVGLAKIVRRALAKDPTRRFQTALDLRNELDELKQELDSGITMTMSTARPKPASAARGKVWAALAAVVVIGALAFAWSRVRSTGAGDAPRPFEAGRFTRLTSSGNAFLAAISADGRYVVHVKIQGGESGLWVRQTATTSDAQIVAPATVRFDGVSYSPDGDYVLYNTYAITGGVATLYKVPILGGTPQRILEDVDSAVSFSPDGRQFAFMRGHPAEGRNYVMIANADGSGARRVGTVDPPDQLQLNSPAWSPDGKTIIASGQSLRDGPHLLYFALDVASGTVKAIGGRWTASGDVQWLPGGASFVTSATEFGANTNQLWEIAFPSGERRRITNDLNRYIGVSLSADARSLVTVQQEAVSNIWVAPAADLQNGKMIPTSRGRSDGLTGVAWAPDGRIVFGSVASGRPEIWIAKADGGEARQLTNDESPSQQPAASPDGRFIVFQRFKTDGVNIWRMAIDGADAQQLTHAGAAFNPVVSPDGRWVFYAVTDKGFPSTWKVPIDGGTAVEVSADYFRVVSISPDGVTLLGTGWDAAGRRSAVATLPAAGGSPTLIPDIPATLPLWMPDGRSISYAEVRTGALSLASMPIRGGAPKTLVKLEDNIYAMAWAPDGRLALARGTGTSDVVLIARQSPTP